MSSYSVASISTYPIKSCHGIDLSTANITTQGIELDRSFAIISQENKIVTRKELPGLDAILCARIGNFLFLSTKSGTPASVNIPIFGEDGARITIKIGKDDCVGIDQGEVLAEWLNQALRLELDQNSSIKKFRLVAFANDHIRKCNTQFLAGEDADTKFADEFPLLITNLSSLEELNKQFNLDGSKAISMDQFRANIVLKGLAPFEEDSIELIKIEESRAVIKLVRPCVSATTAKDICSRHGSEPLSAEARSRVKKNHLGKTGIMFGQYGILLFGDHKTITKGGSIEAVYKNR